MNDMMWRKLARVAFFLAAILTAQSLVAQTVRAADPAPGPSPASAAVGEAIPDSVTHQSMTLNGKALDYTARAGTIVIRDQENHPTASMFYTAFTLDGANPSARPITFVYNGGPGSASLWLRMGSFGPLRVQVANGKPTGPPPYKLVENQYTLLDKTDLVFIDMPGSGFSRILGTAKPKDFFGSDQDVAAFEQFIERYLNTFDRWNSPKFLFGESYGTPRSAMLVDQLQQKGVSVNGVVLLSSILNYGLYAYSFPPVFSLGGGDWTYPLYLPTEAAVAWYHHKLPNQPASLQALLPSVEQFATGEYLNALARGSTLSSSEYKRIVVTLHQYTGLSESYIRASNLRIPYQRFMAELLRDQGEITGRYDGRYTNDALDRAAETTDWDATDSAIDGAFTASNNQLLRGIMKYNSPLLYRSTAYDIIRQSGGWDFKHRGFAPLNTAPDLAEAMAFNPDLHVFSANGYYDFATPFFNTVYVLNHLNLSPALQNNISYGFYPSGHMVYLNIDALAQFHDDLERWYSAVLSGH